MDVVGIHDFSMSDVNAPDAKRTKRALSALINFAKFREERISTYTQQTILTEDLLDRREELQQAVELVQQRLARLWPPTRASASRPSSPWPRSKCCKTKCSCLNKKQAVLQAELRDAKAADQALADKLKQTKQILSQEVNTATLLARSDRRRSRARAPTHCRRARQVGARARADAGGRGDVPHASGHAQYARFRSRRTLRWPRRPCSRSAPSRRVAAR
jgi:hypothetical protein